MNLQEAAIPFSGFYCSSHDEALDCAFEQLVQDDCGDAYPDLLDRCVFDVDWKKVHTDYARLYVENLSHLTEHKFEFTILVSPREYNFTTDRIFAMTDLEALFKATPIEAIKAVAAEMFTSRSGFISYYSPDIDTWGPLEGWDYNQAGALTMAWLRTHHPDVEEDIEESMREALEDLIYRAGGHKLRRSVQVASARRERGATSFHYR